MPRADNSKGHPLAVEDTDDDFSPRTVGKVLMRRDADLLMLNDAPVLEGGADWQCRGRPRP